MILLFKKNDKVITEFCGQDIIDVFHLELEKE